MSYSTGQRFDFLDFLARQTLSAYESRVLFSIIKLHLVYNNGGVIISRSRICQITDLQDGHVSRAFAGLIQKRILSKKQKNGLPFYSLTPSYIGASHIGGPPIQGPPIEVKNPPIREGVIKDSKESTNNSIGKHEKSFQAFWSEYPKPENGSWYESVQKKARAKFLSLSDQDQQRILQALQAYKRSKSVQDKKILTPLNFLMSPKLIDQYFKEPVPRKAPSDFNQETVKKWRNEQEADPPKGSLKESFDKLVTETAKGKDVTKKRRG